MSTSNASVEYVADDRDLETRLEPTRLPVTDLDLPHWAPRRRLQGRRMEREALDRLWDDVRTGHSRVLVVRGEPGIGKSALLDYLADRASTAVVSRATGVESEMEIAFAGLHQLCAPYLDRLERLAPPQRDALATAFGLQTGIAPDRFLVGLAVLSLLADVADERPLLCAVDDAQWLDRASTQTLAFVARRLEAEAIGLVFGARVGDGPCLDGLPQLTVSGLPDDDSRALLESVVAGPLDEHVRDRIVAETRGNPLALLELPRGMRSEQLAGGFARPDSVPVSRRIEQSYTRRLAPLPEATRRLLLVAAAEPTGEPLLVWRAAAQLGVEFDAQLPAAATGLVEFERLVKFRHPLARSAVYRAATAQERRAAHNALADATDPERDPDRRAWHRAQAASGFDEALAAELERSADRAQGRGGVAAAAAFHERAAQLTPDPARRAQRTLQAAESKRQAGATDAALQLVGIAEQGPLDDLQQARAELLRARIAVEAGGDRDSPALLLNAAKRLEPLAVDLARETYGDAFHTALTAGRLAAHGGILEVAAAARAALPAPQPNQAPDQLLDGLALLITEGYAAGVPLLKLALSGFRARAVSPEAEARWLPLACRVARDLWDDDSWYELSGRLVELSREAGALAVLPGALQSGLGAQLLAGDLATAAAMGDEAQTVGRATGNPVAPYGALMLAAWRGDSAEANRLITESTREMVERGEGRWLTTADWVTAVINNALGQYDEALAAAERASEYLVPLALSNWATAELIEAAVRAGAPERAAAALERLTQTTQPSATDWALGIEARSRALLSEGDAAEDLYQEALERLARSRVRISLGRARLIYGEWLRRQHRRVDAREQLRRAYEMLTEMGAEAFAERSRRELMATGETVRKRSVETFDELTPQEVHIGRLAAQGQTNHEIGGQLFLSPRTVEWHLRKIYAKLAIGSRKQLREALADVGVVVGQG